MRELFLIRHATPSIDPNVPAPRWPLSPRGAEEARTLARTARSWRLASLYSSSEEKARSTALILGDAVGLPVYVVEGVQELRIDGWIGNADRFNAVVADVLRRPRTRRRGAERAVDAASRFAAAVGIIKAGPFPAAVVTHGRVLAAWLSAELQLDDPYALWRSLSMPGWLRLDLDGLIRGVQPQFAG